MPARFSLQAKIRSNALRTAYAEVRRAAMRIQAKERSCVLYRYKIQNWTIDTPVVEKRAIAYQVPLPVPLPIPLPDATTRSHATVAWSICTSAYQILEEFKAVKLKRVKGVERAKRPNVKILAALEGWVHVRFSRHREGMAYVAVSNGTLAIHAPRAEDDPASGDAPLTFEPLLAISLGDAEIELQTADQWDIGKPTTRNAQHSQHRLANHAEAAAQNPKAKTLVAIRVPPPKWVPPPLRKSRPQGHGGVGGLVRQLTKSSGALESVQPGNEELGGGKQKTKKEIKKEAKKEAKKGYKKGALVSPSELAAPMEALLLDFGAEEKAAQWYDTLHEAQAEGVMVEGHKFPQHYDGVVDIGGHVNQVLVAVVREGNMHVKVKSKSNTLDEAARIFPHPKLRKGERVEDLEVDKAKSRFAKSRRDQSHGSAPATADDAKARSTTGRSKTAGHASTGHDSGRASFKGDVLGAATADEAPWEDLYCVLYNDGRLRCFESKYRQEQRYVWHLRHFSLEDVDDDTTGDAVDIVIDGHLLQLKRERELSLVSGDDEVRTAQVKTKTKRPLSLGVRRGRGLWPAAATGG